MKQFLLFLFSASCLSVAGWLRADTYTWDAGTGFAWQIGADTDTVWDPDGLPGPDDTIAFDWHRTASISLSSDMEVGGISFLTSSNLTLQAGGTPYYFRSLRSVSTADHDAVRTNTVMYAYTPDGATFQAHAGRNVVLAIHRLQAAHADGNFSLVKTGAGILLFGNNDQTSLQTTNTITVLEGELRMESYAATDNKAATIVIGGGANPATLRVTRTAGDAKPGAHPYSRVYVKPNGRYHFPVKASPVQFWNKFFEVEGGLLDLSGNMLTLRNWDGDTWDYELRLIGGTVTNGVYTFSWLSNTHPVLKALAADTPSVFHADLSMSSRSPLLIERGPAPVGLVLHGQILNRSFIKEGDGVLQLAAPEGNPYYQANSPTLLNAGTILANNAAGWAFGTNGVTMAAGTTLGGTGRVYAGRLNHPITIADNATVQDAIDLFSYYRIGCLPVVDPAGHLVSFLSDGDVVGFISRRTRQQDRIPQIFHATIFEADDYYKRDEDIVKELETINVMYCATKKVQFAYEDDNLAEIAALMDNRRL